MLRHAIQATLLFAAISLFAKGPEGVKLTGKIEAFPTGLTGEWTVAGKKVTVSATTKLEQDRGAFAVGACVDVEGAEQAAAIAATKVETVPAGKCNAGSLPTPGEARVFGPIVQLPSGGLIGTWIVGTRTVLFLQTTALDNLSGPVVIGACVEVEGAVQTGGAVIATKVTVKSGTAGCGTSPSSLKPEVDFRGVVQVAAATAWTISGRSVVSDSSTQIQPANRTLAVGDCVSVKGKVESGGTILASRIEILGDGVCKINVNRDEQRFFGVIKTLPAGGLIGNWIVGDRTVIAGAQTKIEDPAGVKVGACVEVRGTLNAQNAIVARLIEVEDLADCNRRPDGFFSFRGTVETRPAGLTGSWTISGQTVTVDANTSFDTTGGQPVLGACVEVKGQYQVSGALLALAMDVKSAAGMCVEKKGFVNAGSFTGFTVSAGQVFSLFGINIGPPNALPTEVTNNSVSKRISNTVVLFDGTEAALLFASQGQINGIVPCDVAGKTTVTVQVESNAGWSNEIVLPVAPSSPAIFTLATSGTGRGAILNADLSLNAPDNAAERTKWISLYVTGLGPTSPACTDGAISINGPYPLATLPIEVEIGGKLATVTYAGGASGLVQGVSQINATVAADTPVGANVPVRVKAGTAWSVDGVTVSIK